MPVLTTKQIKASLKAVANWSQRAQTICRTFKFGGFLNSIAFVNRITRVAQNLNHYPDIDIRFDQVTLTFTTHGSPRVVGSLEIGKLRVQTGVTCFRTTCKTLS